MSKLAQCNVCGDHGFVLEENEVVPCPSCNPDSGYGTGEYQAQLAEKKGRCDYAKGGGGRTCYLPTGHEGSHIFQCGR